jgi:hypothetical protein
MDILIHTLGRATPSQQHTLRQLILAGVTPTLVVQAHERAKYDWYDGKVYTLPDTIRTLAPTRDHIIHDMAGDDKVVFLDDDLHFAVRRSDDPTKFRQPEPADIREMFMHIEMGLGTVPHVGIGPREGGNRNTEEHLFNTRIMRVLAYRRSYLKKRMITFTPLVVMEDFHVNLQILRSGSDTMVLNRWVSNQAGGSDAPGGCSSYRSDAVQTAAAHMLAAKHPGLVRVVQKATKTAWGGGTRTDVVVQWKQARRSAP